MRMLKLALIATALLAGAANAAVVDVTSFGAWTNFNAKAVNEFQIAGPGRYSFRFQLTPNSTNEPLLGSLFGVSFNLATQDAGKMVSVVANHAAVNKNTFDSGLIQFDASKAGKYLFTLAFTNQGVWSGKLNAAVAPVPEPETYALLGIGLLGLLAARRKKMG